MIRWLATDLPTLQGELKSQRTLMVLATLASLPLGLLSLGWQMALVLLGIVGLAWFSGFQNRWVRLIAVIAALGLLWVFRPGDQQGFFSAAVLSLTALKMLELKTLRDGQFLLNTALFGLFCAALLEPSAWMSGLVIAGTSGLVLGHYLVLNPDDQLDWRRLLRLLKRTGLMALFVAPLFVVLFYAFPRIGGQFFSLGLLGGATSGLTDRLEPGSLADLALSDEVRFRVESDDTTTDLYFRVYVLEEFDGQDWTRSDQTRIEQPSRAPANRAVSIEMPAHGKLWLPVPEWPIAEPLFGPGATLQSERQLEQLWRADFRVSGSGFRAQDLRPEDEFRLTEMPATNPRTDAWIESLDSNNLDDVTAQLAQYFADNLFYSLTPPASPAVAPVDALLFDSKTGFCGHFSNAAAYVYRRLGYPARIVMGFQGGRYNQAGNYIQVRDADAHAWIEVHDGLGWQRIDPTGWIAPDRVDRGIEVFGDALGATGVSRLTFDAGPVGEVARSFWDQVKDGLDLVQRGYERWVVDFDRERQTQLFDGISQRWHWALLILLWPARIAYLRWKSSDPWLRRFDRWARKQGIRRAPWQLPNQVASGQAVEAFQSAWLGWRYGRQDSASVAQAYQTLTAYSPPAP